MSVVTHIYAGDLKIQDQSINQQTGTLSLQLGGVDELKISSGLLEPGSTDTLNLGSSSKKFDECHQNSVHLYSGANKTTITSASTGSRTLVLPADDGDAGSALTTDGAGSLSWGIAPKVIADIDIFIEWVETQKINASDAAAGDNFGFSVGISGDYAIVGAQANSDAGANSGSAYIYLKTGEVWAQQAKLTASDAAADDNFGRDVSINGDYAIVGALYNASGGFQAGSAYIFFRTGVTWAEQAKLTASDAVVGALFGIGVDISGDYAVIGANGDNLAAGSAYIFLRTGVTWAEQAKITASDAAASDLFGRRVSIDGDYVIAGAYANSDAGAESGSAYIFLRTGVTWAEQAKITASDAAAGDNFGRDVNISGDYALITSPSKNLNTGAAYVFLRTGVTWAEQAILTASDATAGDSFGRRSGISGGDYVIIGAFGNAGIGAAYLFTRDGTTWTQQNKVTGSDAVGGDLFGFGVGILGDYSIISAFNNSTTGSAYIFNKSGPKYVPAESKKYIIETDDPFFIELPATNGRNYDVLNYSATTVPFVGTILAGNPTSILSSDRLSAYNHEGVWMIK